MAAGLRLLCVCALFVLVAGDCYLHNPRGSNNRLNERSANRANANRMFDSQNNNRGGYNAGDQDTDAFNSEDEIYYMKYWQSGPQADSGTHLTIEWTNQHGCGNNGKVNCNFVIQYLVQDAEGYDQVVNDANEAERIRNGVETATQDYNTPNRLDETLQNYENRRDGSVRPRRGLHETFDYYDDCYMRRRNERLFTADQRLRSNEFRISSAIYTRQNPNGNRRGYECPEERDYYPYWHPTPWRDIAVLTHNTDFCGMYRRESFNVQPRQRCREFFDGNPAEGPRPWSIYNTEETCTQANGVWFTEYAWIDVDSQATNRATCNARNNTDGLRRVWAPREFSSDLEGDSECLVLPPEPDCLMSPFSRVNHLGNGLDGVPLNYTWRLPYFPSDTTKLLVVRIRYNISTDDYDPWNTDLSSNDDILLGTRSPVTQNPNVNVGSTTNKPLRLAVNTAQFGRTFQDRTHVMELRPRTMLPEATRDCEILNLNVRGKRGNIVQVYPSVEYDFVPNRMTITTDQCLHIQWTGSNTHNNGNPAGDGQAGDAGEGTGGTDRSNIVEIPEPDSNYPYPWENANANMFRDAEVLWHSLDNTNPNADDIAVAFASAGYYHCLETARCTRSVEGTSTQLNQLLNNAPASFEGALVRFTRQGRTYHYICSRNNNFTNRSQKGFIRVISNSN